MKTGIKLKGLLSSILVAAMLASVSACAGTAATTDATTKADTAAATTTAAETEAAQTTAGDEAITLTMWSIATESDSFNPAYTKALADYQAAHPNVTIVHETFENESYKTKIKSAVAANELPDIFYTWGGGFSKSFVESGKVFAIDEYYTDEYKAQLSTAALGNATYDGKIYGVTYTTPISLLFYNRAMFEQYGLTAPTTFDELKAVCQKFLDNGITPFGISVKDTWVTAMCHDALTLKSAGPEQVKNVLTKTEGSYNSADFLNADVKFMELVDMGAFIDGATGLSNDEASAMFYDGTVPMYITGSWMGGSIMNDAEDPTDFDCAPIPVLNDATAKITDFMGGAADTLMVAESSPNKEAAAQAVFELSKSISMYAYLSGSGIPAWKVDYDDSAVNAITAKEAELAGNATSFTLWFDTLMEADDAGEYLALLQELYVGNISPEEFTGSMADQLEG